MFTTTSWSARIAPDTAGASPLVEAIVDDGPTGLAAMLAGETPLRSHATRKARNGIRATRRIMTGMPFKRDTGLLRKNVDVVPEEIAGSYCVLIALSRSRFGP